MSMEFYLNVIQKEKEKKRKTKKLICFSYCLLLFKWLYSTQKIVITNEKVKRVREKKKMQKMMSKA